MFPVLRVLGLLGLLLLGACSTLPQSSPLVSVETYVAENEGEFAPYAPGYVIEHAENTYNRIGTPRARRDGDGVEIYVDPTQATIFAGKTRFSTVRGSYSNLLFRVHFEKVPFSHLGWGKNVGLLLVVTLDDSGAPLLYTLVHTCGCYLAFIPTSYLPQNAYPDGWERGRQVVYGESLPAMLDFRDVGPDRPRVMLRLRDGSHRVMDVWLENAATLNLYKPLEVPLKPVAMLETLPLEGGGASSFFETSGSRRDYVRGSQKFWERLFMGWWALDWRVGEDKRLGRDPQDGIVFNTSLKPWAREASDLRNFPAFLHFWGWGL